MRQILVAAEWSDWEDELFRHCYPPGDELATIRTNSRGPNGPLSRAFLWVRFLKLAFDVFSVERDFDVVIVWQQTVAFFLGILRGFSRRSRPPIVLMGFHRPKKSLLFSQRLWRAFTGMLLFSVDRIVCYSHWERQLLVEEFGRRANKVFFIPFGMDFPFDPHGIEDGYVFSAGESGRDYETLLAAAKLLDFPFKVAAPRSFFRRFEVPKNVELVDFDNWREFVAQLGAAQAVAIPLREHEKSAGRSLLLQAMHLGKAIVATKNKATEGYIESGRNGLLVEGGSPQRLAMALQRVIDDEAFRRRLGKAAIEDAGSVYCSIRFWRDVATIVDEIAPDLRAIVDAA